ncbi:hypothetical protein DFS33DRAFT_586176 [Desarmillaria ectypa]|nr:hypothetical protein DFS33DRAFT_586176 [Desarmillaria ectypa]
MLACSASWQNASHPSEPPNHDIRDSRRHRASTAPTYNPYAQPPPHSMPHPRVLTPGHIPPTIHYPSLYFGNGPIMTTPGSYLTGRPSFPHPEIADYQRSQPWPYSADSYFPPSKPPVPPPAPELIPRLPSPSRPRDVLPIPEESTPISPSSLSAKELAAALQISKSESTKQAQLLEKLSNQEEEDLARALEESLQPASLNSYTSGSPHFYNSEAGPSTDTGQWPSTSVSASGPSASSRPLASNIDDDEAFARRLAAEDEAGTSESSIADDEALARRLAAEEEEEEQRYRQQELEQSSQIHGNMPSTGGLTEQSDSIARTPDEGLARRLAAEEEMEKSRAIDAGPASAVAPPPAYNALPSPLSPNQTAKGSDAGLTVDPQLYRSNSSGSAASYASSESQSNPPTQTSCRSSAEISSHSDTNSVSPGISAVSSVSLPTLSKASENEQAVVNVNQFVDTELLHGVCKPVRNSANNTSLMFMLLQQLVSLLLLSHP